ncbi:MAG TPA: FkbM family methyltransferase, partial [Gemmatimonadales bacterium]|nr:FkbM family methyltransferase [Gemmatimonadales bacterium]
IAAPSAPPTDPAEIVVRLRVADLVIPFHMRMCDIYTLGEILHERQYQVRSPLPERPTIIDAGANIGVATLRFLGQYPGAKLVCVEPDLGNFLLLQANFDAHSDVTLEQVALGAADESVTLHLAAHGAMHSVVDTAPAVGRLSVSQIRLDTLMDRHCITQIDLLKLDVEGSEFDCVRGLGDRLVNVKVIVGEFHERLVDEDAFYRYLEGWGFQQVHKTYFGTGRSNGVHAFEVVRDT